MRKLSKGAETGGVRNEIYPRILWGTLDRGPEQPHDGSYYTSRGSAYPCELNAFIVGIAAAR